MRVLSIKLWQYIIIAIIFVKYYICLCKCDRYYNSRFSYLQAYVRISGLKINSLRTENQ